MTRSREGKTIYNPSSANHSSNNSLVYNGDSGPKMTAAGLHKRSKSTCVAAQKSRGSFSKGKFDLSSIYAAAHQEQWPPGNAAERKSRYL